MGSISPDVTTLIPNLVNYKICCLFGEQRGLISRTAARNRADKTPCCLISSVQALSRGSGAPGGARACTQAIEQWIVIEPTRGPAVVFSLRVVCSCGRIMSGIVKVIVSFFPKR